MQHLVVPEGTGLSCISGPLETSKSLFFKRALSKAGDFSDVMVVDAEGRKIPWTEVSQFDDNVMRDLMRQIVNRLYTFQLKTDDPHFQKLIDRWASVAEKWDDPELDEFFMGTIVRYHDVEGGER